MKVLFKLFNPLVMSCIRWLLYLSINSQFVFSYNLHTYYCSKRIILSSQLHGKYFSHEKIAKKMDFIKRQCSNRRQNN